MRGTFWAMACAAFLSACAPAPEPAAPPVSFRDASAPIGSQSDVQAAQLDGEWFVRARFANDGVGFDNSVSFTAQGRNLEVGWVEFGCGPIDCLGALYSETYAADGAGRWNRAGTDAPGFVPLNAPDEIWVFWVDGDRRTMAIGSPDGGFALILDRAQTGGRDRIVAAREILDWYGFDVDAMVGE